MRAQGAIRLLEVATDHGIDRTEVLTISGLSEDQLAEPDHRVPLARILKLWSVVCERIPDPDFGLEVGCRAETRTGGVLGYAILHSPTLGSALDRFARYSRLITTALEADIERGPRSWRLFSRRPPIRPGFRQFADAVGAGIVSMVREITTPPFEGAAEIDPVEVRVGYDEPEDLSRLRSVFRCDILFGQPRGSITFRAEDVARPTVSPDVRLSGYLEELAAVKEAELPKAETWAERVADILRGDLSEGQPPLDTLARQIGASGRTLQRRLQEEGTSYAGVLDDVRREIASTLIEDPNLTFSEIAYLQGYADPSAFYRAFERWHGCSPGEYRHQQA
jgi:AraC-like DNA-binding protein